MNLYTCTTDITCYIFSTYISFPTYCPLYLSLQISRDSCLYILFFFRVTMCLCLFVYLGSDGAGKFLEQLRECTHIRSFEVTPLVHPVTYALIIEWLVKNKPAKKSKKKKGKGKKKKKK